MRHVERRAVAAAGDTALRSSFSKPENSQRAKGSLSAYRGLPTEFGRVPLIRAWRNAMCPPHTPDGSATLTAHTCNNGNARSCAFAAATIAAEGLESSGCVASAVTSL